MPELRSALTGHLRPGRFGAAGEPLILSERPLGALIQLTGWHDSFADAAKPVLERFGLSGLGGFDRAQVSENALAFRVAPERLLLVLQSPADWAAVASAVDPAQIPFLELSHSRTVIRVGGANATGLLARLMPIDFDEQSFGTGRFVQSGIHSVAVLVHRAADEAGAPAFDIYVPRSFAASTWDFITETALPFGFRVDVKD